MPPKRKREQEQEPLPIPGSSAFPGVGAGVGLDLADPVDPAAAAVPAESSASASVDASRPGLSESAWTACRTMLEDVYKRRVGSGSGSGSQGFAAAIFCALPDREVYADYYDAIADPECLDDIAIKLQEQRFPTPEAFRDRLLLVFSNAQTYNEEDSQVYKSAVLLETQVREAYRAQLASGALSPPIDLWHLSPADAALVAALESSISASASASASAWPISGPHPAPAKSASDGGWWTGSAARKRVILATLREAARAANVQLDLPEPISDVDVDVDSDDDNDNDSSATWDQAVSMAFTTARTAHPERTALIPLQRLYHALTPLPRPPLPPRTSTSSLYPTHTSYPSRNYASYPAGPARAVRTPLPPSLTPLQGGRSAGTTYKGREYRVGDFARVVSPDTEEGVVVQVMRTYGWGVGVRWFYRPEETVHTRERTFLPREVLYTEHTAVHPVEDLIEHVTVQHYPKFLRGRPRAGFGPIYVCRDTYDPDSHAFAPLREWLHADNDIVPFPRLISLPLLPSPHLAEKGTAAGTGTGTSTGTATASEGAGEGGAVATRTPNTHGPGYLVDPDPPALPPPQPPSSQTFAMMLGGSQALDQLAFKDPLPIDTARLFERDARQAVLWFSGPPLSHAALPDRPAHSLAYLARLA